MIIVCPSCGKKFEVDENLIPDKGRLLKCGSCDQTWFFNKNDDTQIKSSINTPVTRKKSKVFETRKLDELLKDEKTDKTLSNFSNDDNKIGSELVKYQPKYNFSFGKLLNYIIVFIITFIAVVIVLDTFKDPLSIFFPNLELVLFNLFETLRDLILFAKDLK